MWGEEGRTGGAKDSRTRGERCQLLHRLERQKQERTLVGRVERRPLARHGNLADTVRDGAVNRGEMSHTLRGYLDIPEDTHASKMSISLAPRPAKVPSGLTGPG